MGAIALAFFFLLLFATWAGRNIGARRKPEKSEGGRPGAGAIETTIFALLGLLIAFTFSGAAQRFSERRQLIVQEVNAIGTAWLRIGLLDAADQPGMRDLFRQYTSSRLDFYHHVADLDQRDAIAATASTLQNSIWSATMAARRHTEPPLAASFIAAVNDMFDASTTLSAAQNAHPPPAIFLFLGLLAVLCAFLIGLNLAYQRDSALLHQILYAAIIAATLYIIIDLEFPRVGFLSLDRTNAYLESARESMGPMERRP